MDCLSDAELQAVVDNEADERSRAHVADCSACRTRADARRRLMSTLVAPADDEGGVPPALEARLRDAVAAGGPARGSTALRPSVPRGWRQPIPWASALAAAAVVGLIVFAGLPRFGAPTSLSASEILGRSLQTLPGALAVEHEYGWCSAFPWAAPNRAAPRPRASNRYRIADIGGRRAVAISEDSIAGTLALMRRRTQLLIS